MDNFGVMTVSRTTPVKIPAQRCKWWSSKLRKKVRDQLRKMWRKLIVHSTQVRDVSRLISLNSLTTRERGIHSPRSMPLLNFFKQPGERAGLKIEDTRMDVRARTCDLKHVLLISLPPYITLLWRRLYPKKQQLRRMKTLLFACATHMLMSNGNFVDPNMASSWWPSPWLKNRIPSTSPRSLDWDKRLMSALPNSCIVEVGQWEA
jgi:hypothetical protein